MWYQLQPGWQSIYIRKRCLNHINSIINKEGNLPLYTTNEEMIAENEEIAVNKENEMQMERQADTKEKLYHFRGQSICM